MKPTDKKKPEPKVYNFYCNACGDQFKANREHARTCSEACRFAIANVHAKVKQQVAFDEADKLRYEEALKKVAPATLLEVASGTSKNEEAERKSEVTIVPKTEEAPTEGSEVKMAAEEGIKVEDPETGVVKRKYTKKNGKGKSK